LATRQDKMLSRPANVQHTVMGDQHLHMLEETVDGFNGGDRHQQ